MARPSKRTPEIVAHVLAQLALGRTRKAACGSLILDDTFKEWCDKDPDLAHDAKLAVQAGLAVREDEYMAEESSAKSNALAHWLGRTDPDWIKRNVAIDGGKLTIADAAAEAAKAP